MVILFFWQTSHGQNQPPTVTATGYQAYCTGSSKAIAETISITDPDDTTTSAVYIQISGGYVNGEDLLSLVGTHPNITSSWNLVEGELSLEGPATYTEFEAAILATEFSSSSTSPTGSRQFSITVGEPNFLPESQHYYEFVSSPGISWTAAEAAAASRTYFGLQGYLVTLTSQEEADFAGQQASGFGWIGATDVAVENEWRWVTGPEAGTLFWQGLSNGTEITYANWNGGEPNDYGSGEDYAHIAAASVIRGGAPIGAWNDLPNGGGGGAYASQGYVVEYGGMPGDPVLNISASTTMVIQCKLITNRNITYGVNKN
ncbi:C-type lectin domain-containing protein [Croceitalea vernalis]|uniref:C-type lectin domain-containing protein n=1 Tax=Croceitalea vernalis TaxID=3075599 RepID=A0ABU3BIJ8_9FLAO|nr:C-type lectin domain-containing protein [Croceitalea sp. P007]MDT0621971.1 C-type lectin domain-containing protein [Croceitalea sp. P007]